MDKLKISEWGERLKTGGAQMGRIVSGKMKEILQAPTPESRMVDDATSETMEEPNWGMHLRICALINSEEFSGAEVVKAIKRKILNNKSVLSQRLSLDLLEACTMNCEKVFSEVSSEKVLDDMIKMIENPQTDDGNRVRARDLIRAWGQSEDLAYLSVFRQTYLSLKARSSVPPQLVGNESLPPPPYSLGSSEIDDPAADTGLDGADHGGFVVNYGSLSAERKKETIEVTRNSLEVLSSMLNIETGAKPVQDDLTMSMVEKCKHSQPIIKMIIESTTDDEGVLFEALHLHDELQRVLSVYNDLEADSKPVGQGLETSFQTGEPLPDSAEASSLCQIDDPPKCSTKVQASNETSRNEPHIRDDDVANASLKDKANSETKSGDPKDGAVPETDNHTRSKDS